MNPINRIFLRVATEESRSLTFANGLKLYFDDSYNENWHRQQIGQAVYVPEKYSSGDNDTPIFNNDIVYFHHLATIDVHKILIEGETLYMQPIDQIFAVKRGDDIICLGDNVFVEQVSETEDDIKTKSGIWLKEKEEDIKQEGLIIALPVGSDQWIFLGEDMKFTHRLKIGCRVKFRKRSEYQINADFGKRKIYKMKLENILMVLD